MLQKVIQASVVIALLTGPAAAQMAFSPFKAPEKRAMTQDEIDKEAAKDREYRAAMQKIPEKKVADPWGNIRNTSPTASAPNSKNKQ